MRLKSLLLTLCLFAASTTFLRAQGTGTLSGVVVDQADGKPASGTTVTVTEINLAATTDLEGRYRITGVPAGVQKVSFFKAGYRFANVSDVQITDGEVTKLDFALELRVDENLGEVFLLDAVDVSAEIVQSSQLGLISSRQKAIAVSDAIGSEQFSRFGVGDAAEAMGKVTGASVVDGKYVFVRGLGDRYSNTLLNGATVPSADPDKRAVQMDQFPADLLESINTSKSFTPDQPGSFSGGSVNIKTKSFPDFFFIKLGADISYNTNTTGEEVLVTEQGVDLLAMGKDDRRAPTELIPETGIPVRTGRGANTVTGAAQNGDLGPMQLLDDITRAFPKRFYPLTETAPYNYGANLAFGNSHDFEGDKKLGYTFSLSSSDSYSHYEDGTDTRGYSEITAAGTPGLRDKSTGYSPDPDFLVKNIPSYSANFNLDENNRIDPDQTQPLDPYDNDWPFGVTQTVHSVSWGAFGKLAFQFSPNHEIDLTLFHNQSADDEVTRGVGYTDPGSGGRDADFMVEGISILYTERGISSMQLAGKHFFEDWKSLKIDWQVSSSRSTQDQPDYRTLFWGWNFEDQKVLAPGNNLGTVDRLFRDMTETRDEGKMDFALTPVKDLDVKFGFLYGETARDYNETGFNVTPFTWGDTPFDTTVSPDEAIDAQFDLIRNIYTDDYIGYDTSLITQNGNSYNLIEAQRGRHVIAQSATAAARSNIYTAEGKTKALYLMADTTMLEDVRLYFGARFESNEMSGTQVNLLESVEDVDFGFSSEDILPAFGLTYSLSDAMNVRFAYGRTLALPTFKELSPIEISNRFSGETEQGNPFLDRTLIDNYDLRWELFLDNGQMFAVSLFYKTMSQPIEIVVVPAPGINTGGDDNVDIFQGNIAPLNVDKATVYGIEFEWRYSLGGLTSYLENFTIGGNLSVIESEVDVPQEEIDNVAPQDAIYAEESRALVGQSPIIANADISYDNFELGTYVTLAYNFTGDRLALVNPNKIGGLGNIFEEGFGSLTLTVTQRLWGSWEMKFSAKNLLDPERRKYYENLSGGEDFTYTSNDRGRTFSLSLNYTFD